MLNKLRDKSEHVRMVIAGVIALVITLIVIFFWIWSTFGRFEKSKEVVQDDFKPFSVLRDSFSGFSQKYKADRAEFKESIQSNSEPVENDSVTTEEYENFSELETLYGLDIIEEGDDIDIVEVTESGVEDSEMTTDESSTSTE